MKLSLRVPLILTWTMVSGAGTLAAVACSSSSEPIMEGEDASHPMKDSSPPADRTAMESSRMEASNADVGDVVHAECIKTVDGAIVYYESDGETCPHPECERITDSSLTYFEADGSSCPDGDPEVPIV